MTTLLSPAVPPPHARPAVAQPAPGGPSVPPVPSDVTLYALSVEQYHEMIRHGILRSGDQVELLEGLLVQKMTKNPPHVLSAKLTADALRGRVPAGYHVAMENPFTTTASEPEPDVAVVRGSPRDYSDRHPTPVEMALIVEVADSSVGRDRGIKRRLYARAGVPVYWIVVLPERVIEVYADPSGPTDEPTYASPRRFAVGEMISVVIDGREVGAVPVADLLP